MRRFDTDKASQASRSNVQDALEVVSLPVAAVDLPTPPQLCTALEVERAFALVRTELRKIGGIIGMRGEAIMDLLPEGHPQKLCEFAQATNISILRRVVSEAWVSVNALRQETREADKHLLSPALEATARLGQVLRDLDVNVERLKGRDLISTEIRVVLGGTRADVELTASYVRRVAENAAAERFIELADRYGYSLVPNESDNGVTATLGGKGFKEVNAYLDTVDWGPLMRDMATYHAKVRETREASRQRLPETGAAEDYVHDKSLDCVELFEKEGAPSMSSQELDAHLRAAIALGTEYSLSRLANSNSLIEDSLADENASYV